MQVEFLNNFKGEKVIDLDTETPEGRAKVAELFTKQLRSGAAIFLERADRTYRVTGYDQETDKLIVDFAPGKPEPAPEEPESTAHVDRRRDSGRKCSIAQCGRPLGPNNKSGICTRCRISGAGAGQAPVKVKRTDRVSSVSPVSGGAHGE